MPAGHLLHETPGVTSTPSLRYVPEGDMSRSPLTPRGRIRRRSFLAGTGALGLGIAGASLIGCGTDDDDPTATATSTTGSSTGSTGTGTAAAGDIKRGGTYSVSIAADPPSIDLYSAPSFAARQFAAFTYSRLFKIDAQPDTNPFERSAVGDLADTVETEDGITWIVKLKQGVKYHNVPPVSGRELTTEDVAYSWEKLTGTNSTLAGTVQNITGMEVIDEHTLQFTHDAPNADFTEQLADGFIFWVVPTESEGGFDPAVTAIGTGPWMLEEYVVGSRFRFNRHPEYYASPKPYVDSVEQVIIPEYANQMAQFQAHSILQFGPRADDVLGLRSQIDDLQWLSRVGTTMWGIFFSPEESDPDALWRDERLRIAASYAINRGELHEFLYNVKALQDAGFEMSTGWNNQVSVGMGARWWLDPQSEAQGPSAAYFEHNPEEARKLLDAVGATQPIPFMYTDNRYGATFGSAAQAITGQLMDAGFVLDTQVQDYSSVFITQTWQGRFSGMALGNFGGFSSLSGYLGEQIGEHSENKRLLHTPDMLDLFERQAEAIDIDERQELVHDIQRLNAEKMYIVPTTGGGGTGFVAYHPEVRGIRDTRGLGGPTEQYPEYWLDT